MEREKIDAYRWSIKGYFCKSCKGKMGCINFGDIKHCPYCGSMNIIGGSCSDVGLYEDLYCEPDLYYESELEKKPADIVYQIKSTNCYNYSTNEERKVIDRFLNELRYLAEKGENNE